MAAGSSESKLLARAKEPLIGWTVAVAGGLQLVETHFLVGLHVCSCTARDNLSPPPACVFTPEDEEVGEFVLWAANREGAKQMSLENSDIDSRFHKVYLWTHCRCNHAA